MPAIHFNHISFRYSTLVDIFVDADFHLGPGWTGVVGANGSGKTTLLRLVAGQLATIEGALTVEPADAVIAFCEQTVEHPTADIVKFAESWDGADASLRGRLHLDVDDFNRWPTLSPGERKRWQIGAALSREPDVLLLDEPTNHLDSDARDLMIASLARFSGVGLVVSHDRSLLEELPARTMRIDRGEVSLWNGGYGAASEGWRDVEATARTQHERLKAEAKKTARHLADLRQVNEQKRARFKKRNNTVSFKDIDSRSAGRQAKHRNGDKAAGKALATATRASGRATEAVSSSAIHKTLGGDVSFAFEPARRRILASHLGPLVLDGIRIIEHVDIAVEKTDRIWLRGPNGVGKTTLVRRLVEDAGLPAEKLLYLEQEMSSGQVQELMRELETLQAQLRGDVLAMVALLGVDPEILRASRNPSPGEARKLAIALGLGRSARLVVLDEPTNHLDLPSIERLERALVSYPGALVVVSHDEEFARNLRLEPFDLA